MLPPPGPERIEAIAAEIDRMNGRWETISKPQFEDYTSLMATHADDLAIQPVSCAISILTATNPPATIGETLDMLEVTVLHTGCSFIVDKQAINKGITWAWSGEQHGPSMEPQHIAQQVRSLIPLLSRNPG